MRNFMLALVGAALLSACAATPQTVTHIDWQAEYALMKDGRAMVYVVRPWRGYSQDNLYRITIDGQSFNGHDIPDLGAGRFFQVLVEAKTMRIGAQVVPSVMNIRTGLPFLQRAQLRITTKPGEFTFIRVGVNPEGGPVLTEVDGAEGQALVEHARRLASISTD